jgi:hypothetical protein
VKLLIDHGADVAAEDETQSMPLHLASSLGTSEPVRVLIEHGADVCAQDANHRTPLHLAASRVSVDTVKPSIEHKLMFTDRMRDRMERCIRKGPKTRLTQCSY